MLSDIWRVVFVSVSLSASTLSAAYADQWTGLYIGGALGAGALQSSHSGEQSHSSESVSRGEGWSGTDTSRSINLNTASSGTKYSGQNSGYVGYLASPHIGASVRMGALVFGAETSLDWVDFRSRATVNSITQSEWGHRSWHSTNGGPFIEAPPSSRSSRNEISYDMIRQLEWKFSAVARVGILVTDDIQLYGLGGYARGGFSEAIVEPLSGWVVGGGAEYALGNSWFAKIEYRMTRFGDLKTHSSYTDSGSYNSPEYDHVGSDWLHVSSNSSRSSFDTQDIRIGVSYRFWP